jgi:hypothetical protein
MASLSDQNKFIFGVPWWIDIFEDEQGRKEGLSFAGLSYSTKLDEIP